MELTKEQLLQIDSYIYVCGIKFYDVRTEIVDHFANILEQKLDETPDLDFKKEIRTIHKNFSNSGFSKLLKEKTKSVKKKFYNQSLKHLVTFFKLPKIIITGTLFYVLLQVMNLFKNKENFFNLVTGLGFLIILGMFFSFFIEKKKKKELFLALNMNNSFFQFMNFSIVYFGQISSFRGDESFTNTIHNNMHLSVFVMLLLFYWSCQSVFKGNKKLIKEQYPNVIV